MSNRENSCLDQLLYFTSTTRGHETLSIGFLGLLDGVRHACYGMTDGNLQLLDYVVIGIVG
jgi:hypothetical protein